MTDRKRTEQSLRLFRTLLDRANDLIFVLEPVTFVLLDANDTALRKVGYTREELLNVSIEVFDAQTAGHDTMQRIQEQLRRSGHATFETVVRRKDGSLFDVEAALSLVQLERPFVIGIARDITERKQTATVLRSSETKLSNALELARLGSWEYDVASNLFTFTDQFYAMFHTTVDQVGGYTMSAAEYAERFVHPDDRPIVHIEGQRVSEATDPHYSRQFDHRIIYADGGAGYITVRVFVVKDENGRTIKTYGVNQDITERKRAEETLRESEERLRLVVEASNNGIWEWDVLSNEVRWSDRIYEMFVLPKGTAPIPFEVMKNLVCTEDRSRFVEILGRHLVNSSPYDIELRFHRGDGNVGHFLCRGKALMDETGRGFKMFGSIEDITERKHAMVTLRENEARLRLSLNEKEVLLKEIHHRVKNNLQTVSSLLSLQAASIESKELAELFKETQNRVRTMASIHEQLYRGEDLARIDFGEHTRDLVEHLIRVYNPSNVRSEVDVEQIHFGVDTAIPCSLIINELVSNSLTHAFRNRESGWLYVGMHKTGSKTYRLQVKDDGVGLPKNVSWVACKSLGLELVKTLTEQIHGSIDFENGTGASFSIVFDLAR